MPVEVQLFCTLDNGHEVLLPGETAVMDDGEAAALQFQGLLDIIGPVATVAVAPAPLAAAGPAKKKHPEESNG